MTIKLLISTDGSSAPTRNKKQVKSAIGYFIEAKYDNDQFSLPPYTGVYKVISHGQSVKCKTSNESEFMAILMALQKTYKILIQKEQQTITEIEIVSDSSLAISCITRKHNLSASNLLRIRHRIDKIVNGLEKLGISIEFTWKRRNSTEGLKMANNLAQSSNKIRVH